MDQTSKGDDNGKKNDFFEFWENASNAWQKNLQGFSQDFANSFTNIFSQENKGDFLSAYTDICKNIMQNSTKWPTDPTTGDVYGRMCEAANVYTEMLKSFPLMEGLDASKMPEQIKKFADSWADIQKKLFSNMFGTSMPNDFMKGADLSDALKTAFSSYTNSLKSSLTFVPEELKPFFESYFSLLEKSADSLGGVTDAGKFGDFHKSWSKAYDDLFGKYLTAPLVGPSRKFVDKIRKGTDSFFKYLGASSEFYTTMYQPGMEAIDETAKKAGELFQDSSPENFRKFYDFLLKSLEMKFFELFKTPGFGEALKANLDASLEFRSNHFELLETMLRETPLVTHTEVDEIHEEVYKLKKRVKELEKFIKDLKAAKA